LNIDMKRTGIYKILFKSKKPSLGSILAPGLATSTSTNITSSTTGTDLMVSIPACDHDSTTRVQVTAGVSVSVQFRPSHLKVLNYCYREDRSYFWSLYFGFRFGDR
jgi:hypothetical protein